MIPEPNKDQIIQGLLFMRGKIAQGWCRNGYAKKRNGETCSVFDPEACEWCLNGTLMMTKLFSTKLNDALRYAVNKRLTPQLIDRTPIFHHRVFVWNDTVAKDQKEVLEVIDDAIDFITREIT